MSIPTIQGVPPLRWLELSGDAALEDDGTLKMVTGEKTDWFNPPPDPSSPAPLSNAPVLVFDAPIGDCDWQLSAKVIVDHQCLFDAGTIFVCQGPSDWCKLCFEFSPEQKPTVVSVVTRKVSDDANGTTIEGNSVYLRVSKYGKGSGSIIAFHYSINNGEYWTLHRAFCMRNPENPMSIGFLSQAPTGEACTARFSNVSFTKTSLENLRDGN